GVGGGRLNFEFSDDQHTDDASILARGRSRHSDRRNDARTCSEPFLRRVATTIRGASSSVRGVIGLLWLGRPLSAPHGTTAGCYPSAGPGRCYPGEPS